MQCLCKQVFASSEREGALVLLLQRIYYKVCSSCLSQRLVLNLLIVDFYPIIVSIQLLQYLHSLLHISLFSPFLQVCSYIVLSSRRTIQYSNCRRYNIEQLQEQSIVKDYSYSKTKEIESDLKYLQTDPIYITNY